MPWRFCAIHNPHWKDIREHTNISKTDAGWHAYKTLPVGISQSNKIHVIKKKKMIKSLYLLSCKSVIKSVIWCFCVQIQTDYTVLNSSNKSKKHRGWVPSWSDELTLWAVSYTSGSDVSSGGKCTTERYLR